VYVPPPPSTPTAGGPGLAAGGGAPLEPSLFEDPDPDANAPHGTVRTCGAREEDSGTATKPLRERLRSRRPYWRATMDTLGVICALTLSILDSGYRLQWAANKGVPPPVRLANTRSAFEHSAIVSAAVA
jgi:hypothetical protein